MAWLDGIRGVLLDVDGTLLSGDAAIPGAAETLGRLRRSGIGYRLITNTTRKSRADVARTLQDAGIEVQPDEVLAPAALARRRVLDSGKTRAYLLVSESTLEDFDGVTPVSEDPDWVVMGDMGSAIDWETMNRAFLALLGGAGFLALHRNRYWHAGDDGYRIDAGAFVVGLEYVSGVSAEVVGKPARGFFELALGELGIEPAEALVVGDDVTNEGSGAAAVGCRTAIVRTGKFRAGDLEEYRPDLLLDSVADLLP